MISASRVKQQLEHTGTERLYDAVAKKTGHKMYTAIGLEEILTALDAETRTYQITQNKAGFAVKAVVFNGADRVVYQHGGDDLEVVLFMVLKRIYDSHDKGEVTK